MRQGGKVVSTGDAEHDFGRLFFPSNVEALIIRIGFWAPVFYGTAIRRNPKE